MGESQHEDAAAAVARLEADGLVVRGSGTPRTTRRWQGAMARAAVSLYGDGDDGEDLRVPIAVALHSLYGDTLTDDELTALVVAMLPIELAALGFATPSTPTAQPAPGA